ncbi:hypothetical protein CI109_100632 [Kwoniella shandongensis]|uniref:Uncharacterized protein n=1 Tax=Kwoniella shandongensis TaxID=1734106 RepID=A0A5M6BZ54_9TREE|nr:uncharacterized protein CI109_003446 [Kwoniella shandongensis]KAA5528158.1 hypothetical protein CI109_003446 [Kwoniella shandongensis]
MPRVTKKQKEAGVKPKPKVQAKSGYNAGAKQGFKVGPSKAPRDAYLGKAKKIKADLIQRAKMKKQYAKVLKSEGMASDRLGDGTRRRGERDDNSSKKGGRPVQRAGSSSGSGSEDGGDSSDEERGEKKGGRVTDTKRVESRAGPSNYSSSTVLSLSKRPAPRSENRPQSQSQSQRPTQPPKPKVRALSPSPPPSANPSATTESKTSFRQIKREAFSKYHKPKDVPTVASYGGGKRGQPNMGARMGALLEKIKMDKGR